MGMPNKSWVGLVAAFSGLGDALGVTEDCEGPGGISSPWIPKKQLAISKIDALST